jgi:hypothetical protein
MSQFFRCHSEGTVMETLSREELGGVILSLGQNIFSPTKFTAH